MKFIFNFFFNFLLPKTKIFLRILWDKIHFVFNTVTRLTLLTISVRFLIKTEMFATILAEKWKKIKIHAYRHRYVTLRHEASALQKFHSISTLRMSVITKIFLWMKQQFGILRMLSSCKRVYFKYLVQMFEKKKQQQPQEYWTCNKCFCF